MSSCREVALTLSHAFASDAYAQYLVDDPCHPASSSPVSAEAKWSLHVDIMTCAVASHILSGLATTTGPDCDSVALWIPPGASLDGFTTLLRSGMWRLYLRLSGEGRKRYFSEVLPLLHDTKREVLGERDGGDERAWYLVFLGTKEGSRGRGYARRLLEEGMRQADADNAPIYLESSSLANNTYYAKYGFEVKRDIFLVRGKTPVMLSIMVREPGAGRKPAKAGVVAPAAHLPMPRKPHVPMHGAGAGRPVVGSGRKGMLHALFGGGNGRQVV